MQSLRQGLGLGLFVVCLLVGSNAAAQTPSSGWNSVDIGASLPGLTDSATNGFWLNAAGSDIWNRSDGFRFVYRSLTGDGAIVTRVENWHFADPWSKAGVMVRESLAGNAKHAFMMTSGTQGLAFQYRSVTDDWTTQGGSVSSGAPVWLRIERQGTTLTGSYSTNGTNWTTVGQATIAMANTVYIGLALTSHATQAYASADFTQVSASTSSTSTSSSWSARDIGGVKLAGSSSVSGSTVSMQASGADIWDAADEFRFVYQPLSGDGTIVARLTNLEATDSWTKAGVMIRETLDANSKHALMLLSGDQGFAFQRRTATGGWTDHTWGGWNTAAVWLKLERRGSTITAAQSSDGSSWTTVGSANISMSGTAYIGLALTSHTPWAHATADFSNVSATGSSSPASGPSWTSTDIGSPMLIGSTTPTSDGLAVTAGGADIWGTSDQFRFAYQAMTGDGSFVASVPSLAYADAWSKSGVMIRESLNANAAHAFMFVSGTEGLAFQRRRSAGGTSLHTSGPSNGPGWVRVERRGSTFTGSYSWDGINWATVGSDTIAMGATVYVGLAVTSHATSAYTTGTFSNLSLGGVPASPSSGGNQPPIVSLTSPAYGASFPAPATITLAATASDPDGGISSVEFYAGTTRIGADSSSPYSVTWSNVAAGSYSLTAVARDLSGAATASSEHVIWVGTTQSSQAVFTPSANHGTSVMHYVLDIFPAGADPNLSNPIASGDLGLPAVVNGECRADITGLLSGLWPGVYFATVTAVGTGGSTRSAPSPQFSR